MAADAEQIGFGEAFTLTVVRSWRRDLVPQDWGERAFAPLRLRLVGAERRENATHVEDERRYQAFAFGRDPLVVALPPFRARARDGSERSVPGPELRLRVHTSLPEPAGAIELPGEPLSLPAGSGVPWTVLGAIALAAALGWLAWRRRAPAVPRPSAVPATTGDAPHQRALQRLAALAGAADLDAAGTMRWFTELAAIVRDYAGARFAVRSAESTTEELLGSVPLRALDEVVRARAARTLGAADLVKFARALPGAEARREALADAEGFVRATAPEEAP